MTPYLREAGFPRASVIKFRYCANINVEQDMRVGAVCSQRALLKFYLRVLELILENALHSPICGLQAALEMHLKCWTEKEWG